MTPKGMSEARFGTAMEKRAVTSRIEIPPLEENPANIIVRSMP